jgi:hypothetical protein
MGKVMSGKKALIAGVFAVLSGLSEAQEFTPFEIEDMIKAGYSSCLQSQLKSPGNAGADPALLRKYCQCFAHKFAARAQREDANRHERGDLLTARQITEIQAIGKECSAEITR